MARHPDSHHRSNGPSVERHHIAPRSWVEAAFQSLGGTISTGGKAGGVRPALHDDWDAAASITSVPRGGKQLPGCPELASGRLVVTAVGRELTLTPFDAFEPAQQQVN